MKVCGPDENVQGNDLARMGRDPLLGQNEASESTCIGLCPSTMTLLCLQSRTDDSSSSCRLLCFGLRNILMPFSALQQRICCSLLLISQPSPSSLSPLSVIFVVSSEFEASEWPVPGSEFTILQRQVWPPPLHARLLCGFDLSSDHRSLISFHLSPPLLGLHLRMPGKNGLPSLLHSRRGRVGLADRRLVLR